MPELRQPGTGQPYQLDNLVDFTGGLNRSDDTSNVAGNQLIELTNMDPDPNGGVRQRRAVVDMHTDLNASGLFDTTNAYQGMSRMGYGGNFGPGGREAIWGNTGARPIEGTSAGRGAIWTPGGTGFYSTGHAFTGMYNLGGYTVVTHTDNGAGGDGARYWTSSNWQSSSPTGLTENVYDDDYESPSTPGHPYTRYACVQHNRAWAVSNNPGNRVRFSHPGTPLYWHTDDWVDIGSIASDVVGIYPIGDMVVAVKQDSCWAILGNTLETIRIEKILDAQLPYSSLWQERPHCTGGGRIWLWTVHNGLVSLAPNGATEAHSEQLRRNRLLPNITEISYAGNKVWCRAPDDFGTYVYHVGLGCWSFYDYEVRSAIGIYEDDGAPADVTPSRIVALDPRRDLGVLNPGDDLGSNQGDDEFAIVEIDADLSYDYVSTPEDLPTIAQRKIACAMRTGWLVGQLPTERKRWGRPRILVESYDSADVAITVQVYKNYEETATATATYTLDVSADGDANIFRGPSGGRAEAISYRITTPSDSLFSDWGIAVISPRFKPFRIKR